MNFDEMPIRPALKQVLADAGYVTPTPIQDQAIPILLEGHDFVGVAQTGTGKTLSFLVPIFNKLEPQGKIQALVICPTRELALQVGQVATQIGTPLGLRTVVVYGGTSTGEQRDQLRQPPDLIVGTPGRLIDFLSTAWLAPRFIRWFVLDEADRMLDMGFIDDVVKICSRLPPSRQTMLFSATMPPKIEELAQQFMYEPRSVRIEPKDIAARGIEHRFVPCGQRVKQETLVALMARFAGRKTLVFTATREATSEVARVLHRHDHEARSLSSLHSQANRERVLDGFRNGEFPVLVATDVAARGIDIADIELVINFDLPRTVEEYVHRVGRTGRVDREGLAISLVTPLDRGKVHEIETILRRAVPRETADGDPLPPDDSPVPKAAGRGRRKRGGGGGAHGRERGGGGGETRRGGARGGTRRPKKGGSA